MVQDQQRRVEPPTAELGNTAVTALSSVPHFRQSPNRLAERPRTRGTMQAPTTQQPSAECSKCGATDAGMTLRGEALCKSCYESNVMPWERNRTPSSVAAFDPRACPTCGSQFEGPIKRTLLGLRTFVCPSCHGEQLLPMSTAYRIGSWVILLLLVLGIVSALAQGQVFIPGWLFIAMGYALVKDWRLRSRTPIRRNIAA
jgi:hypothetical protein